MARSESVSSNTHTIFHSFQLICFGASFYKYENKIKRGRRRTIQMKERHANQRETEMHKTAGEGKKGNVSIPRIGMKNVS